MSRVQTQSQQIKKIRLTWVILITRIGTQEEYEKAVKEGKPARARAIKEGMEFQEDKTDIPLADTDIQDSAVDDTDDADTQDDDADDTDSLLGMFM